MKKNEFEKSRNCRYERELAASYSIAGLLPFLSNHSDRFEIRESDYANEHDVEVWNVWRADKLAHHRI